MSTVTANVTTTLGALGSSGAVLAVAFRAGDSPLAVVAAFVCVAFIATCATRIAIVNGPRSRHADERLQISELIDKGVQAERAAIIVLTREGRREPLPEPAQTPAGPELALAPPPPSAEGVSWQRSVAQRGSRTLGSVTQRRR